MNIQDSNAVLSHIEGSFALTYTVGYDLPIIIHYCQENLYFLWMMDENMLSIKVPCEASGHETEISVMIDYQTFAKAVSLEDEHTDLTTKWQVNIFPEALQLAIGEYEINFVRVIQIHDYYDGYPCPWHFDDELDSLTSIDANKLRDLLAVSTIAIDNNKDDEQIKKYPQLRGININCFSDILELAAFNKMVSTYRYINGHNQLGKAVSFTISPEVIFQLGEMDREEFTQIKIRTGNKCVSFELSGNNSSNFTITTSCIPGFFCYPRIVMNNIGNSRLSLDRVELIEALRPVIFKDDGSYGIPRYDSAVDVQFNEIQIQSKNSLAWIESSEQKQLTCHLKSAYKKDFSVWLDGQKLNSILLDLKEKEVYFVIPDNDYEGVTIETDNCQYVLLGLKKISCCRDLPKRRNLQPDRKIIHAFETTTKENTVEIAMVEVPLQESLLEDLDLFEEKYDFDENGDIWSEDFAILTASGESFIDELNSIFVDCVSKGIADNEDKALIDSLKVRFDAAIASFDGTIAVTRECSEIVKEIFLLRSRLLRELHQIPLTYQLQTTFR